MRCARRALPNALQSVRDQLGLVPEGDVEPFLGLPADRSIGVKQVGSLKFFHAVLSLFIEDPGVIRGVKTLLVQSFLQVADVISGLADMHLGRHCDMLLSHLGCELFVPLIR